jgi:predicted DNA-binding transcriptional regulator AlpA
VSKNEHLIPTAHVAKMLGVDVRTVHRMADSGLLPAALKLPGKTGAWLFDRDAVQQVADSRATEAAAS